MTKLAALKERLRAMPSVDVPTGSIWPAIEDTEEDLKEGARLLAWFFSYSLRENPYMEDIEICKEAREYLKRFDPNRSGRNNAL